MNPCEKSLSQPPGNSLFPNAGPCRVRPHNQVPVFTRILAVLMRGVRVAQGMSQGFVARTAGVARQAIGQMEHADFNVTVVTVRRVCRAMRTEYLKLLARAEEFAALGWQV